MITVPVGGVYEVSTPGLESDYYLTACDGRWGWLDINKETFEECFEEVCDE